MRHTGRIGEASLIVDGGWYGGGRGKRHGERHGENEQIGDRFHVRSDGVGESGDQDLDTEEVGGRMGVAVEWAGLDRGLIEQEELLGVVAGQGALQRPVLHIAGDPDLIVPTGDGGDGQMVDSGSQRALRAKHGFRVVRVGAGEVFQEIAGAIVVRIRVGIDAQPAEMLDFPAIGQTVGIGVGYGGGRYRIDHLDEPGMIEGRAALGCEGGKWTANGGMVESRAAGGLSATGVDLGRGKDGKREQGEDEEWLGVTGHGGGILGMDWPRRGFIGDALIGDSGDWRSGRLGPRTSCPHAHEVRMGRASGSTHSLIMDWRVWRLAVRRGRNVLPLGAGAGTTKGTRVHRRKDRIRPSWWTGS